MKTLIYKFQNPHNSCEAIYICKETGRHYSVLPYTPYSVQLCTCTPSRGYYEADCPVKSGLVYIIDGVKVVTENDGEIIDHAKREEYENSELSFFKIKPEFLPLPNYENFTADRLFPFLFDWMPAEHFDKVILKRKHVCRFLGGWYLRG